MSESVAAQLIRAHYYLMENSRFWYDKGLINGSRILCVTASNMREEMRRGEAKHE